MNDMIHVDDINILYSTRLKSIRLSKNYFPFKQKKYYT